MIAMEHFSLEVRRILDKLNASIRGWAIKERLLDLIKWGLILIIAGAVFYLVYPKYGFKPYDRPYPEIVKYAVINLDKPSGPSSHEVAAWVKNILKIKRAGHSGTLAVIA